MAPAEQLLPINEWVYQRRSNAPICFTRRICSSVAILRSFANRHPRLFSACGRSSSTDTPSATSASPATTATHEHKAPHGGLLVEVGEEFAYIELVLDRTSGTLTAYMLDE
jgi:hypothetical protein